MKLLLTETSTAFKDTEGDIRALYKALRQSLHLDPAADEIDEPLKPILDGFQTLISDLYGIANKGSDRRARSFNPAWCHAKLAVSAVCAL